MIPKAPPKVDPTAQIWISENSLFISIVFMMVFGSIILVPTAYIRWRYKRLMEPEVIFIVLGYLFFLAHGLVMLSLQPLVYRLSYVALGQKPYYPEIDIERHQVVNFAHVSTYLLHATLWCIKFSLFLLFRQFIRALPEQLRWWNMVLAYLIITFIFGFCATFSSCGGPRHLMHIHYCQGPANSRSRNVSLFGWFVADITTDLLIMLFPLRLVFKMRISRAQKIRAGALCSVGILCMITAILRLVQIGSKTGSTNPNVQWLALWGTLEATTGIVVGCLPTYRFLFKPSAGRTSDVSLGVPDGSNVESSLEIPSESSAKESSKSTIHLNAFNPRRSSRNFKRGNKITSSMENLTPPSKAAGPPVASTWEDHPAPSSAV
ncbi:uncharacterized protein GIQ15_01620 [Arthroderma uncinatum]|uniref:uncharacterized protein n=1 Tax=Arthroderma uncinatum TaxID=74035 RepID=UPI00144A55A8|nr:uncharacterized protein GIQ15_01620 [Arthroderma uncinatum]KAF3492103.1 hypothetical protein GIQ15_01620 [Arthroderma uncinatum]